MSYTLVTGNYTYLFVFCLSFVTQMEKQSLLGLNHTLQEKEDLISKLEGDLRESQKVSKKRKKVQPYLKWKSFSHILYGNN